MTGLGKGGKSRQRPLGEFRAGGISWQRCVDKSYKDCPCPRMSEFRRENVSEQPVSYWAE